jgi:hypothetical protein
MFGRNKQQSSKQVSRRQFVGGLSSLLAAAAFSQDVPASVAAQVTDGDDAETQTVSSPDGTIEVTVGVADGVPTYSVAHEGTTVVSDSTLGFEFQNQPSFGDGLAVTGSERSETDTVWEPVWDRYDEIEERYTELRLGLEETGEPGRAGTLELRVFDDGLGFRFVFGDGFGGEDGQFVLTSERTDFDFAGDYTSWWIPNDYNNFEVEYRETPLSEIAGELDAVGDQIEDGGDGIHTPTTLRTDSGRYQGVYEADLTDYASLAASAHASSKHSAGRAAT